MVTLESLKLEPGIFLTYFESVPEIDSSEHTAYDRIQFVIKSSIGYEEIDVTAHTHMLRTSTWLAFQRENLNDPINMRDHFEATITRTVDKRVLVVLVGKKTCLWQVKAKIEQFIVENSPPSHVKPLDTDSV